MVEPSVDLKSKPTGSNTGKFLQEVVQAAPVTNPSAPQPQEPPAATETVKPRAINPWIVALAVIIPTFMEVLDTTIANVALRYIAGGLSHRPATVNGSSPAISRRTQSIVS